MANELSHRIIYEILSKFDDFQILVKDWETRFGYLDFEDMSNTLSDMIDSEYKHNSKLYNW